MPDRTCVSLQFMNNNLVYIAQVTQSFIVFFCTSYTQAQLRIKIRKQGFTERQTQGHQVRTAQQDLSKCNGSYRNNYPFAILM